MYIQITLSELMSFTTRAVEAGVSAYERSVRPAKDKIKQSEAKRYLASQGLKPTYLTHLVGAGLVRPRKSGSSQNSPVYYSLSEIQQALCAIDLKKICNEQAIREDDVETHKNGRLKPLRSALPFF